MLKMFPLMLLKNFWIRQATTDKESSNQPHGPLSQTSPKTPAIRVVLINMKTGKTKSMHVSHGVGSGDGNGNAIRFSNTPNSKASSPGLYLTAETYHGKHGYSLRMDGLESTNSKARKRAIVIHGADYVPNSSKKQAGRIGRSWGCPAVARSISRSLIDKLKGGSLYYIHR